MRPILLLIPALALALATTGCTGPREVARPYTPMVSMQWLGKNSFRISSANGLTVVTDPFRPSGNLTLPDNLQADVVLMSHEGSEANNVDAVVNSPLILRGGVGLGSNRAAGLAVTGVRTDAKRGNLAYGWRMDGLRFAFLGRPSAGMEPGVLRKLGPVDVLFMPFGEDEEGITDTVRRDIIMILQPRLVVAMGPRPAAAKSLTGSMNVQALGAGVTRLTRDNLPQFPTIGLPVAP